MSAVFIFINGCLLASAVIFLIGRFRNRKYRKQKIAAQQKAKRRPIGETPFRKKPGGANIVLHYPPAHFDGRRHRAANALDREGILFSITRNPMHAVKKEPEE